MIGEEYVAKVAEHLSKSAESRELEMKEALRKAELRKSKAQGVWLDAKASLSNAVERIRKLNSSLQFYDPRFGEAVLTLAAGSTKRFRNVNISFDDSSGIISYRVGDGSGGTFEPSINGEDVLYEDMPSWNNTMQPALKLPMRADDIAKRLIEIACDYKF